MKKISKKVREEAIEALLCTADSEIGGVEAYVYRSGAAAQALQLAERAINSFPTLGTADLVDDYLEAAALLRAGWCPGDPVIRLGGAS